MARGVTKQQLGEWQISKTGKVATNIGKVRATDAAAAIKTAIREFDIAPEQRDRIAARPIVVR